MNRELIPADRSVTKTRVLFRADVGEIAGRYLWLEELDADCGDRLFGPYDAEDKARARALEAVRSQLEGASERRQKAKPEPVSKTAPLEGTP